MTCSSTVAGTGYAFLSFSTSSACCSAPASLCLALSVSRQYLIFTMTVYGRQVWHVQAVGYQHVVLVSSNSSWISGGSRVPIVPAASGSSPTALCLPMSCITIAAPSPPLASVRYDPTCFM